MGKVCKKIQNWKPNQKIEKTEPKNRLTEQIFQKKQVQLIEPKIFLGFRFSYGSNYLKIWKFYFLKKLYIKNKTFR